MAPLTFPKAAATLLAAGLVGCGVHDPGEPFPISFVNTSGTDSTVRTCVNKKCTQFGRKVTVAAHTTSRGYALAYDNLNRWVVVTEGEHPKCLSLRTDANKPGLRVRLARARPC